jgi:hypothetical protein
VFGDAKAVLNGLLSELREMGVGKVVAKGGTKGEAARQPVAA